MIQQRTTLGLTLLATAALVACGGGGGGGGTTTAAGNASLSGAVIDGAIEGAIVCLDLNNSLSCDSGEPSATTAANGSYTLNTSGLTAAQIKNAHVFVTVPLSAKDADDSGQTLAQAGKASFNLLAPAESAVANDGAISGSVVVSPLTTLVSHTMMIDGSTAELAKGKVRNQLGLSSNVDITQNYVGKPDGVSTDLAKKAQILAAATGQVMVQISTGAPSSNPKIKFLGALDYLQTNGKAVIDAATNAPSGQTPSQAVQSALQTQGLQPVVNTLLSNAQSTVNNSPVIGATSTDFDAIVAEGFYSGYCANGSIVTSATPPFATTYTCSQWSLSRTISSAPGQWQGVNYFANAGDTVFTPSTGMPYISYRLIEGIGWVQQPSQSTGTYANAGSGLFLVTQNWGGNTTESFKIRMSYKDVSGLKFSDIRTQGNMPNILMYSASTVGDTVFPLGSKLIQTRGEGQGDRYWLDSYPVTVSTFNGTAYQNTPLTSLDALLTSYATPSAPVSPVNMVYFTTNGNTPVNTQYYGTFDAGGTSNSGQMTVWEMKNGNPLVRLSEKASYSIQTVFGQTVLITKPSATPLAAREKNTGSQLGGERIFSVRAGKVYQGAFQSSAASTSINSAGISWNRTAAQAIIKAMGVNTLPQ